MFTPVSRSRAGGSHLDAGLRWRGQVLAEADPLLKREVYSDLGIQMTYRPADDVVEVSADPVGLSACRRGDLNPHALGALAPQTGSGHDSRCQRVPFPLV